MQPMIPLGREPMETPLSILAEWEPLKKLERSVSL
jgi:hypothetical protein